MPPDETQMIGVDQQPASELSLSEIIRLLYDNLWLILLIVAAASAGAYYIIKTTPITYKSTAVLIAEFHDEKFMNFNSFEETQYHPLREQLRTIKYGVDGMSAMLRVADIVQTEKLVAEWSTNYISRTELARILSKCVVTSVRASTRLLDVSAIGTSPDVAQQIAQTVVEQYVAHDLADRHGTGVSVTNFLKVEAIRLRDRLNESEAMITVFLRTNSITFNDGEDFVSSEFESLSQQLMLVKGARMRLETDLSLVVEFEGNVENLLTIPSVYESAPVTEIRKIVMTAEIEMVNLKQRYKSKHPKMIEAVVLLKTFKESLDKEVKKARSHVSLAFKQAKLNEQKIELAVIQNAKRINDLNVVRMEFNRLKQSAERDRELYETASKRSREAEVNVHMLQREDAKANLSVFEPASLPISPFAPNKRKIIAIALVLGMGLSLGLIFLLYTLDTTVRSVDQAERLFGIPVLGSLPNSLEITGDNERLILAANPNSLCAEAFRTLRAAITLLGRQSERKVVLFTSAIPSEGKTFCSSNFALASAMQGKKTLVVDFDLRRPSVGDTFGIDGDKIGVSDCLLGNATIEESAIKTEHENLYVIPAGTMVPNPSELIASDHTGEFIMEAREKYDQVILDNAPITAVSDTLLILNHVDTVCLVSRAAKTSYRLIARALELIRRGGVVPSGMILNFVPQKGRAGYYYYYNSDKSYYAAYGQKKKRSKQAY